MGGWYNEWPDPKPGEFDLFAHSGRDTYWEIIQRWYGDQRVMIEQFRVGLDSVNTFFHFRERELWALDGVWINSRRKRVKLRQIIKVFRGYRPRCPVCHRPIPTFIYAHGDPRQLYDKQGYFDYAQVNQLDRNRKRKPWKNYGSKFLSEHEKGHIDCWIAFIKHWDRFWRRWQRAEELEYQRAQLERKEMLLWTRTAKQSLKQVKRFLRTEEESSLAAFQSLQEELKHRPILPIS